MSAEILKLCAAGPIARVARAGHAPFDLDDPVEIAFASGAVFHVDVGFEGASDIAVREGPLLEHAYGHLRSDDPAAFAAIERDWSSESIDLPWLIGAALKAPRRLTMTHPYRLDVGFAFEANGRLLALFGEADTIFVAALDDPEIASFALEVGAAP